MTSLKKIRAACSHWMDHVGTTDGVTNTPGAMDRPACSEVRTPYASMRAFARKKMREPDRLVGDSSLRGLVEDSCLQGT